MIRWVVLPHLPPTEAEVAEIIAAHKRISADVVWQRDGVRFPNWTKFQLVVDNDGGWDLVMYGNVQLNPQTRPPKRSYCLVFNQVGRADRIYALDVNGLHTNRVIDNNRWHYQTHKQRWLDGYGMRFAYTPEENIPETPNEAFLEFCAECNIVFTGEITGIPAV